MKIYNIVILFVVACLFGCAPTSPEPKTQPQTTLNSEKLVVHTLTWEEQQNIWKEWLADTRMAVKAGNHPEDLKILEFLEKNGVQKDVQEGKPSLQPGDKFTIHVVTPEQADAMGISPDAYASYRFDIGTLVIKEKALPKRIRGTIGFHEASHAYRFRKYHHDKELTPAEKWDEEVKAYEAQCRQFRKLYSPGYERLRSRLISALEADIKIRLSKATNGEEEMFASFPSFLRARIIWEDKNLFFSAFSDATFSISESEMENYFNFTFIDVGLDILQRAWAKDPRPTAAQTMKGAFLLALWSGEIRAWNSTSTGG